MSNALMVLFAFIPSSLCAAGAVYLAAHGARGWGWFLFAAIILGGISIKGA